VVLDSISPSRFANGLPDATAEAELELDELVVVVEEPVVDETDGLFVDNEVEMTLDEPERSTELEVEVAVTAAVVMVELTSAVVEVVVELVELVATELELIALDVVVEETVSVDDVACSACANTLLGVVVEEGNGESTLDEAESSVAVMSKDDVELP